MPKSIQQTIKDVAKALRAGVNANVAKWALVSEGWHAKRAALIIRWAQQINKGLTPYTSATDPNKY
jgi:hypothetical protein